QQRVGVAGVCHRRYPLRPFTRPLHMRRSFPWLGLLAVLVLPACGDDGPSDPGGPVDVTFETLIFSGDTVTARVIMDDTLEFVVKGDTVITGVPSGQHTFEVVTTLDYLPFTFTQTFSTSRDNEVPIV